MARATAFTLSWAVLALCASLAGGASSPGFDYLMLSRQWGPTFCQLNTCSSNAPSIDAFTIHGLWPSNNSGSSPAYCNSSNKFSTKNLESATLKQMNCEWFSLSGSNEGFWSSEWAKHGTCSLNKFPTQQQYFSTALQLADKYDLDAALTAAGISLQAARVSPAAVTAAVQKAWGVPPTLVCVQSMLFEVRTCFDPALRVIQCPTSNQCSATNAQQLPAGSSDVAPSCALYFNTSTSASTTNTTSGTPRSGGSAVLLTVLLAVGAAAAL